MTSSQTWAPKDNVHEVLSFEKFLAMDPFFSRFFYVPGASGQFYGVI